MPGVARTSGRSAGSDDSADIDLRRIGVEVEQTPRHRDEGGRLHLVRGAAEDHLVPVGAGGEGDHRVRSVGGPHRATERRPVERLDTRDRAIAQEAQERIDRDRRYVPEPPQTEPRVTAARRPASAHPRAPSSVARRDRYGKVEARGHVGVGQHVPDRAGGDEAARRRSAAWVAVLGISSTWWVTSMVVGVASAVEDSASSSSSRPGRSRPAAGSSSRRSSGRPSSARASNTRWRSPWLHVASGRCARSPHPTRSSRSSARRRSSASNVCIHGTSVDRLPVSTTSRAAKCNGDGLGDVMTDEPDPRSRSRGRRPHPSGPRTARRLPTWDAGRRRPDPSGWTCRSRSAPRSPMTPRVERSAIPVPGWCSTRSGPSRQRCGRRRAWRSSAYAVSMPVVGIPSGVGRCVRTERRPG